MSATKTTMTAASIGFALIFGGGLYVLMNLNSIAHRLAEDYASRTLGVAVSIGSLDVSLQERHVVAQNIKIDNPPGYENAHAATVQKIDIQAGNLSSKLLAFNNVAVEGADIYLEVKPQGTNFSDIRANLNRNAGKEPSAGEQALKVIVEKLLMTGTIHPSVTIANMNFEAVSLPPLELHNIGGQDGVAPGEAIAQIWVPLSKQVLRAANKQGYLQGLDSDALKEAGIGKIEQMKDEINKEIDTQIDAIGEGLKGLLGDN